MGATLSHESAVLKDAGVAREALDVAGDGDDALDLGRRDSRACGAAPARGSNSTASKRESSSAGSACG